MSDLVGNSRRHVLSCRVSNNVAKHGDFQESTIIKDAGYPVTCTVISVFINYDATKISYGIGNSFLCSNTSHVCLS